MIRVGDVEIAPIESEGDGYNPENDGLTLAGWAWRPASEDGFGRWSYAVDTAREVLADAIRCGLVLDDD